MEVMDLWAELGDVGALMESNCRGAMAAMARTGLYEQQVQPPRSVRKDQRKAAMMRTHLAGHYAGVPEKTAQWGHEAHAEGLRAFGIDRSTKTSKEMKVNAHDQARQAHLLAARHMEKGGHEKAATLHKQAAQYHGSRVQALTHTEDVASDAPAGARGRCGSVCKSFVRGARRSKPYRSHCLGPVWHPGMVGAGKCAKEPAPKADKLKEMLAAPKSVPVSERYHDDVREASAAADSASETADSDRGSVDSHHAAARMHFIAHGVAKAHGNHLLAERHLARVHDHRQKAAMIHIGGGSA